MLKDVFLLILGLAILIYGGDFLVKGATKIALSLHISPLVVGLTIVAFGTSAPEMLISITSALAGSPDLTMGNVIGSNICNLALVLGITVLIGPIKVKSDSVRIDWPMAMGSSAMLYFLVREGVITTYEGIIFICILGFYTFYIIQRSRKISKTEVEQSNPDQGETLSRLDLIKDILLIVIGCLGLYYGSEWFVTSAQELARHWGVSERVIGITVLALGTSLPELVTAITASLKRETDLALGNLMGSNIFNVLSILGVTSIIKEIHVSDEIINHDMLPMLGITLIILPMMLYNRKIGRIEGGVLLFIYLFYTYTVVT